MVAAPKPILCLDTCDILEVVQCLHYERFGAPRSVGCIETVVRLIDALSATAEPVHLIITELVTTEWNQNIANIRIKAEQHLAQVDEAAARLYQAAGYISLQFPAVPAFTAGPLVDALVRLSQSLLNRAIRLEIDHAIVQQALHRVYAKTRPSQDGHIKDSIHLEHYLELVRQLRALSFCEHCIFVSGNRRDYWEGDKPQLHPTIRPEFNDLAVQFRFFGSIDAALGFLGV